MYSLQRNVPLPSLGLIALTVAGVALGSDLILQSPRSRKRPSLARRVAPPIAHDTSVSPTTVAAARRLNWAAGTLALSVLADSAIEHYRGSFKNKAMITPLVVSALALATSAHGTADSRPVAHVLRDAVYALAAGTGLIGTGFHVYNVGKKIGGFSWQNIFYGAPLGAPFAILLSGLIGFCSERSPRHAAMENSDNSQIAGRARHGGGDKCGTAGHDGRGWPVAFSRRFPQSPDDPTRYTPSDWSVPHGVCSCKRTRARSVAYPLVDAVVDGDGVRWKRPPRLRRVAKHGRLAQLESKPPQRAPAPGTTKFRRPCSRRPRRARSHGRPPRCLSKNLSA